MSITRRQFLLGTSVTAAGVILPTFFDKAFAYFENHGEPLLIAPRDSEIELFAVSHCGDDLELNLGDPYTEPPQLSIREFADRYMNAEYYVEYWTFGEFDDVDWDAEADQDSVDAFWFRHDSPNARAFYLLEDYDLGADLVGDMAIGEIQFIDCPHPGSDYIGVDATDYLSLSLLQQRLNALKTGIRIKLVQG